MAARVDERAIILILIDTHVYPSLSPSLPCRWNEPLATAPPNFGVFRSAVLQPSIYILRVSRCPRQMSPFQIIFFFTFQTLFTKTIPTCLFKHSSMRGLICYIGGFGPVWAERKGKGVGCAVLWWPLRKERGERGGPRMICREFIWK